MHDSHSTLAPAKGRCLLWGGKGGLDRDTLELRDAFDRGGWKVSVRPADAAPEGEGDGFDVVLVEDILAVPADAVLRSKRAGVMLAGMAEAACPADRLAPYDILFCAHPRLASALRGYGLPVHCLPSSALDRGDRCLEILERHWRRRREQPTPVDWSRISYGHAEIGQDQVSEGMLRAWQSEEIPARQRALVRTELEAMYQGRVPAVYQALADALGPYACDGLRLLEIGCASGYYREILEYLLNRRLEYEGVDYSEPLIRMARGLYPRTPFHVADGARLPFPDGHFPVAVSSCVLLHVPAWREHIRETARVAGRVVIAHRTPVCRNRPTLHQRKFAYGVETVELLFNEEEILSEFRKAGLHRVGAIELDGNPREDAYCLTYIFEKQAVPMAHPATPRGLGPGADPDPAGESLLRGEAAYRAGDLALAKACFDAAAALDPGNLRLANGRAILACEEGDVRLALDILQKALARDPMHRLTLINLGGILGALDQGAVAAPLLDRYLAEHPGDAEMLALRNPPAAASAEVPGARQAPAPRPLAVAWRNRSDMTVAKGGDGTVIEETTRCLAAMGHRADIRLEAAPDLSGFDLVHLNNISRSQDTLDHLRHAKSCGKPAVLTSLYEDMDRYLRPALRTDLLFRYLATKRQVMPLEALPKLRDSFELEKDPLDDPLARSLGIGDPVRQKAILDGVDLILTSGKGESECIRRKFRPETPIMELRYGFNRAFQASDPRIFTDRHGIRDFALCVGRLEPRKNQWQLIEIFRSLPKLKLVLVGVFSDPSMEPLIKAYAPPNVVFLPRLSLEELASAYAASRLHVLPSWYELPGLVSLEAAAAGARVATTDWGTSRDYFGDLAYYLPPDDPVRMKEVLLAAFDSVPKPGLREHVLESFSWEKTARAAVEAYRRVLEGR